MKPNKVATLIGTLELLTIPTIATSKSVKKLFLVKSGHVIDLYQSNSFFDIKDDLLSVVKLLVDE